jgi:quinol monooxygenase YgiN
MAELIIVAKLRADPGKEQELLQLLADAAAPTHDEEGCVFYAAHVSRDDPNQFVLVEGWASQNAYDAHVSTPYVAELIAGLERVGALKRDSGAYYALGLGDPRKGKLGALTEL